MMNIFIGRLADFGKHVGVRIYDLFFLRNGKDKRETRLTYMLVSIQKTFWKVSENTTDNIMDSQFYLRSFYSIEKPINLNKIRKNPTSVCNEHFSISSHYDEIFS